VKVDDEIEPILTIYDAARHELTVFMNVVAEFIGQHPDLTRPGDEVIHSYKKRLKDRDHLRRKIERKRREGKCINSTNLFSLVTDLAGVRILHLFQHQFGAQEWGVLGRFLVASACRSWSSTHASVS
jgi:putative GTP pyrophosphokinase